MIEQNQTTSQNGHSAQGIESMPASASKVGTNVLLTASDEVIGMATAVEYSVIKNAQQWFAQGTETIGKAVTPVVDHPFVKYVAKVPGINWLLAALGQVDVSKVEVEVKQLQQENGLQTPEQLAHQIMVETALKAGGIGLVTNILPPIALSLFAVDIVAIAALQAEMVYRIAGIYGFPLNDPTRRGEVLAIFGLSIGGSGALKSGLSFVELIPLVGPVVGATSDAALIYGLGYIACQYYGSKRKLVNR
jgi:uncharacterized protein (DUF697 family)